MKSNRILNILIAVLIVALTAFFATELFKRHEYDEQAEIANKKAAENIIPTDENAINLLDGIDTNIGSENSVFLTYSGFLKGCKRTSCHVGETSVTYRFSRTLTSGGSNVYLLNFKMRAEDEAAQISVNFGTEHTYYLTTEWRDFYVPCAKGKIDSIKISLTTPFQKVYLSDLTVLRYDPLMVDFHFVKNGSYNAYEGKLHLLHENEGIGVGKTMDIVGDGKYLYSAGEEKLTVSEITEDGTKIVSVLEGIGNIRHLEIRDEVHLAAASRETGVYIINVADKGNPYIESYYDSLEIANDVCFSGNYMIVAGRYFGVEIVDISDISNPKYISRLENGKECFRCSVSGNYLFVSCWATGEIEIYDISALNNPELISTINVPGRCAEAFIDGNLVYVASGYNNLVNSNDVGDPGYGTGNAVTIFDISDPKRPAWVSTLKTEGPLSGYGYDDWSVQVSNGYVYFTNSFGGMYIYDVRETKKPLLVAQVAVEILPDSENYIDFSQNARTVFPYNPKEKLYSPIMGVHIDNGRIYFATPYKDVYEFAFEGAKTVDRKREAAEYRITDKKSTSNYGDYTSFLESYDVYRLAKHDDCYVAATSEGLLLLDENLAVLSSINTEYPVKDVCVTVNGIIVTAETEGVGLYDLDNGLFIRKGFIESQADNRNVSSIGVTGDGNFAVVQSSWTRYELIDIKNTDSPSFVDEVIGKNGKAVSARWAATPGNMYYRNIVSGTVDGAVGIGGGGNMVWFGSENGKLHIRNSYPNVLSNEINGSAPLGSDGRIISLYYNAIVMYKPLEIDEAGLTKLEKYYVPNVRLKGKISIYDNILAVCNAPSGIIQIVNITDPTRPYLMVRCNVEESPGIALVEDGFVLVPIRHGGIIRIDID